MSRKYKKKINGINDIPETEVGDLLLMAIAMLTTESRKKQTPDEALGDIQKRRFDVMFKNSG